MTFEINQYVDAMDVNGDIYEAKIINKKGNYYMVNYGGWSKQWIEYRLEKDIFEKNTFIKNWRKEIEINDFVETRYIDNCWYMGKVIDIKNDLLYLELRYPKKMIQTVDRNDYDMLAPKNLHLDCYYYDILWNKEYLSEWIQILYRNNDISKDVIISKINNYIIDELPSFTIFMIFSYFNRLDLFIYYYDIYGKDILLKQNKNGDTVLSIAYYRKHYEICYFIMEMIPDFPVHYQDINKKTIFHYVNTNIHSPISLFEKLMKNYISNIIDKNFKTPLEILIRFDMISIEKIKMLLQKENNIFKKSINGEGILDYCKYKYKKIIELYIKIRMIQRHRDINKFSSQNSIVNLSDELYNEMLSFII